MRIVATIDVGGRPTCLATLHGRVLVTNGDDDGLSVIDCSTDSVPTATIDVGAHPFAVAAGPDDRVWVTHDAGMVSMIDGFTDTVSVIDPPRN